MEGAKVVSGLESTRETVNGAEQGRDLRSTCCHTEKALGKDETGAEKPERRSESLCAHV